MNYRIQWKRIIFTLWKFQKEKRKEKGTKSIFKTMMVENLPNPERDTDIETHEAQKIPHRLNLKRTVTHNVRTELSKVKKIILKAARAKREVTYKRTFKRPWVDFLSRKFSGRERIEWHTQNIERKKDSRKTKKQKNKIHNKEINQSIETD